MKKLTLLLLLVIAISCKKSIKLEKPDTLDVPVETYKLDKKWAGDSMISYTDFVKSIDRTCKLENSVFNRTTNGIKKDSMKCSLSKITFDFQKLDSVRAKKYIGSIGSHIKLFIKKSIPNNTEGADIYNETTLYLETNKNITDSVVIYRSISISEALTIKERNYFIKKNKIYLLDLIEDESGTIVQNWSKNTITPEGYIKSIILTKK